MPLSRTPLQRDVRDQDQVVVTQDDLDLGAGQVPRVPAVEPALTRWTPSGIRAAAPESQGSRLGGNTRTLRPFPAAAPHSTG